MVNLISRDFVGFSSVGAQAPNQTTVTGKNLVKIDLLNDFMTRHGECIGRAKSGCGVWDILGQPNTQVNRDYVENECRIVCERDVRITVTAIDVSFDKNSITVKISLIHKLTQTPDSFLVAFDLRQGGYLS